MAIGFLLVAPTINFSMLNYKNTFFCLWLIALITSCKSPYYNMTRQEIVDKKMIAEIAVKIEEGPIDSILSYTVYKAEIAEKLVENNAVTEYTLVNKLSKKDTINIAVSRSYNALYFYELASVNEQQYGILLGSVFNAQNVSLGYGPLYIGFVSSGDSIKKFTTEKEFEIKKKMFSGETYIRLKKKKPGLVFMYKKTEGNQLRFFQVIQKSKNKISGINKFVVYDTKKVFNDPDALGFYMIETH